MTRPPTLSTLTSCPVKNAEILYWSYSQTELGTWSKLREAREEFEINPEKGSEPDLIILTDQALFFVEAKLTATNNVFSRSKNPLVEKKYTNGGNGWFSDVFSSNFSTIAVTAKKYELLRFWLIGSWIANKEKLKFFLINLVLSKNEKNIESLFKQHIREKPNRTILRTTWERIYDYISLNSQFNSKKEIMLQYFKNKTLG